MQLEPNSVFVNCPYDRDHAEHIWALCFATLDCGFQPVMALTRDNGNEYRLSKIRAQIHKCRLSIHDLSRLETARFNMPLELGLAMGIDEAERNAGTKSRRQKKRKSMAERSLLIISQNKSALERACSDIRGIDTGEYATVTNMIERVARWLSQQAAEDLYVPEPSHIAARFADFFSILREQGPSRGVDWTNPVWPLVARLPRDYIKSRPLQEPGPFEWA